MQKITQTFSIMEENTNDKLYCPFCGSSQLTANKKGFGAGKAITGAVLTGGVGLLAGFIGSGNVKITYLRCGNQWKPGQLKTEPLTEQEKKGYYDSIKLKEEAKRKEEEPMNPAAKICLTITFFIFFLLVLMMCK